MILNLQQIRNIIKNNDQSDSDNYVTDPQYQINKNLVLKSTPNLYIQISSHGLINTYNQMMSSVFNQKILEGKTAFITGGATGICYVIVREYLKHGAKVTIISRKIDNINKAVESLKKETKSQHIYGFSCDIRKPDDVQRAVKSALQKMGSIDILINGAAGNFLSPFENLSINAFKTVLQIDTLGTFIVSKIVYDRALKGKKGVIINISANLHYNGCALQIHSGTAKAGVDAMTKHLAVQLGPKGIRVVGICPGPIQGTAGMQKLSLSNEKQSNLYPLQRNGNKEDIANAAIFLASDGASYITGHTLLVDGGQTLTMPNMAFSSQQFVDSYSKL